MGEGEGIGLRGEKETEDERRGKGTEGREGRKGGELRERWRERRKV